MKKWEKRDSVTTLEDLFDQRSGSRFEIENYLSAELPMINNLEKIAKRLLSLLVGNVIVIFTDYDADGMTSAIILLNTLQYLAALASKLTGKEPSQILLGMPDRLHGGYGFQPKDVNEQNAVYILLDNGIVQYDAIQKAVDNNCEVIVIDHHEGGEKLPNADIVCDPKVTGAEYQNYCAAGLTFRLAHRMLHEPWVNKVCSEERDELERNNLFIAAVGTVGDVVPVLYENRAIIKEGLSAIPEYWQPVVDILMRGNTDRLSEQDIAFKITPAFNAVGRMGQLDPEFMRMLMSNASIEDRRKAAMVMEDLNAKRKNLTEKGLNAIQSKLYDADASVIVVQDDTIHPGVVGIVAGKLGEEHRKPVFVFGPADENGNLTASARNKGSDKVSLKAILDEVNKTVPLVKYGGHQAAAGVTIRAEDLETFRNACCEAAKDTEADNQWIYDFDLDQNANWFQVYDRIREFAPYGQGNPEPVFRVVFNPTPESVEVMGAGSRHVKMLNKGQNRTVCFNFGDKKDEIRYAAGEKKPLVIYGTLNENCYQGGREIQLVAVDIEFPEKDKHAFQLKAQKKLAALLA